MTALSPAVGQTVGGAGAAGNSSNGFSVTLGVASTLRFDDNLELDNPSKGNTSRWENRLSLGIESLRANEQLRFDVDGLARVIDRPVTGVDYGAFEEPSASLTYFRDSGNSRFSADAFYSESDLDFFQPLTDINLDGVIDEQDLIDDSGTRINSGLDLQLQTGINAPLGFVFDVNHRKISFEDTLDPGLFDSRETLYSVTSLAKLSQVTQGRVQLSFTDYDASDAPGTERETTDLLFGVTHQFSPILSLDIAAGRTRIDETQTAFGTDSVETGANGSLTLTRTLPNGSISLLANRNFDTNGERSTIEIERVLTLRSTNLSFSLGATRGSLGDVTAIGSLDVSHSLPRAQLDLSLARVVRTSSLDNEVRLTTANLGYTVAVNAISSLAFDLNYAENVDAGAGTATERERASLLASYNRQLTPDWNLAVGYEYRSDKDDTQSTATGNAVFLTLSRQFTLKP